MIGTDADQHATTDWISGWADYTFQEGPLTGFGFGGGVRYVGKSFADDANTHLVPSVVLGDATIHYEWQNWRAALNVINIADKIYVASCASAYILLLWRSPPRDGEPRLQVVVLTAVARRQC